MKKLILLILISTIHMSAQAQSEEWNFQAPNKENPFFSDSESSFKGTFTLKADEASPGSVMAFDVDTPKTALQDWVNTRYMEGKAIVLRQKTLSENSFLYVYQIHQGEELRWICVYTKEKSGKTLLLSYEAPEDILKKDFPQLHESILKLLKSL